VVVVGTSCTDTASIYLPTTAPDAETHVVSWFNRGFCGPLSVQLVNFSCDAYSGPFSVAVGSGITFNNITPAPDLIIGDSIVWNNISLVPLATFNVLIEACVPLTLACGDTVELVLTGTFGSQSHHEIVRCSFDPNDKQVSPVGIGPDGLISENMDLTYTIRFQNTGTFPATFINIKDVIDSDLDLYSFRLLTSSHPVQVSFNEGSEVEFFFNQINLPDSASDPLGSCGFVRYVISPKLGTLPNTVIENTAHIYFDFNEPVITNTTLNTITEFVSVQSLPENSTLSLYPNPNNGQFALTLWADAGTVQQVTVFDLMGRPVFRTTTNTQRLDLGDMPAGHYVAVVNTDRGVFNRKFVVVGR
jgi:hypothetical protein